MAPSGQISRPAARVHQQDGQIGADFENAIKTMRQRLAAHPVAIQCPIGKEDLFIGVIDFLEEKAIIWLEETLGAKFEVFDVAQLWDPAFLASRRTLSPRSSFPH